MSEGDKVNETTRHSSIAAECFVCLRPMSQEQDLVSRPSGVVGHRACVYDGDAQ